MSPSSPREILRKYDGSLPTLRLERLARIARTRAAGVADREPAAHRGRRPERACKPRPAKRGRREARETEPARAPPLDVIAQHGTADARDGRAADELRRLRDHAVAAARGAE